MKWLNLKNKAPEKTSVKPEKNTHKCKECGGSYPKENLTENQWICPLCDHHERMPAYDRIKLLLDKDTFVETNSQIVSTDFLDFYDGEFFYDHKLKTFRQQTHLADAVVTGKGKINGDNVNIACMDFSFMGGSMGSVVGEKITRAIENATKEKTPMIIICSSGGARMQEGVLSLMQMAKTSAALKRHDEQGLLYIAILTNPTTGGVTASFAMLGDFIVAEPKALIGFAGPRVISQTIKQKLPEGFQRSEFIQDHGFVDFIAHRKELKEKVSKLICYTS